MFMYGWISAVMTVIPTCSSCPVDICGDDSYTNIFMSKADICGDDSHTACSCPVDICGDDSYTNMFMSMKRMAAVMTVIPTCSCPVDICDDDSHTNMFMSGGYLR
jgi:hypothetical protein